MGDGWGMTPKEKKDFERFCKSVTDSSLRVIVSEEKKRIDDGCKDSDYFQQCYAIALNELNSRGLSEKRSA